jgi:hypothetical protein
MSLSEEHGRGDSCRSSVVSGPVRTVSQRLDVENILDGILLTIASLHQAATLDESSSITAAIPATLATSTATTTSTLLPVAATCNDARPAYRNFNQQSSSIHHCSYRPDRPFARGPQRAYHDGFLCSRQLVYDSNHSSRE